MRVPTTVEEAASVVSEIRQLASEANV